MQLIIGYIVIAFLFGFWPFSYPVTNYFLGYDEGYQDGFNRDYMRSNNDSYLRGYDDGDFDDFCLHLYYDRKDYSQYKSAGCDIK